jgi:hypothetical protein
MPSCRAVVSKDGAEPVAGLELAFMFLCPWCRAVRSKGNRELPDAGHVEQPVSMPSSPGRCIASGKRRCWPTMRTARFHALVVGRCVARVPEFRRSRPAGLAVTAGYYQIKLKQASILGKAYLIMPLNWLYYCV